jgi:hypothetical protein
LSPLQLATAEKEKEALISSAIDCALFVQKKRKKKRRSKQALSSIDGNGCPLHPADF